MKEVSCASLGNKCNAVLSAPTDDRLMEEVSLHMREAHGMTAIPQEMVGKIKQAFINKTSPDAAYVVDRIFEKYNCRSEPACTWRYIAEAEMILTGNTSVHEKELKAA